MFPGKSSESSVINSVLESLVLAYGIVYHDYKVMSLYIIIINSFDFML